jgi:hypothetical protein
MTRAWVAIVPLAGLVVAISLPFVWSWQGQRDESTAIAVLTRVREVQETFRSVAGAYATDIETLQASCAGSSPDAMRAALGALRDAGYELTLRATQDIEASGTDCTGRPTAGDYYVAAAPIRSETYAQRAYAARADGRIYVFFDRVPPRESDIEAGLATPLDQLEEFRIP